MAAGDPVPVEKRFFFLIETSRYFLETFKGVAKGFIGAAIGGGDEGGGVASYKLVQKKLTNKSGDASVKLQL